MRKKVISIISALLLGITITAQDSWVTPFELSGGLRTATYEEVLDYCKRIAEASPKAHYQVMGYSAAGDEIPLVIINKTGLHEPAGVKESGNVILLVEAGIHPGEAEGTDAVLMLMRDLVITGEKRQLLGNVTFLFVPVFNVDGLRRFGPFHRINQNGPEQMGWRTNSQNLNLNRDFLKADTPEMEAWLKMFSAWLPDFFIDCHASDGADYQYVITYVMEIFGNMDPQLTRWQEKEFLPWVQGKMDASGHLMFPYVSFRRWHDPESGLRSGVAPPRLSQGYTAIQNRPGLLIETHMLKPHKDRCLATYALIELSANYLNMNHEKLKVLNAMADETTASEAFRDRPFPVSWKRNDVDSIMIEFKGVEYDIVKSELTGGDWHQYHTDKPTTYQLPWFRKSLPDKKADLPEAYIVPPQWNEVITRLGWHGIEVKFLTEDRAVWVEQYHFSDPAFSRGPYEGRFTVNDIAYEASRDTVIFRKGSAVVDMNQRTARVIANILEPHAPDSYLQWGFFTAIFEQKEYSETYVMEGLAREMLENDPKLLAEFEKKKAEDPEFTRSQWGMLNWFYARSPWWDEQKNIYPVGRILERHDLKNLPLE